MHLTPGSHGVNRVQVTCDIAYSGLCSTGTGSSVIRTLVVNAIIKKKPFYYSIFKRGLFLAFYINWHKLEHCE